MSEIVTDTYGYDAYGVLLNQIGAAKNPYLYRGEQFDAKLSSYYLRARYYQTETGRFYNTDPMEGMMFDPMTFHRYLSASNDPVNNVDLSGALTLNEQLVAVNIVGGLAAYTGWALGAIPVNEFVFRPGRGIR